MKVSDQERSLRLGRLWMEAQPKVFAFVYSAVSRRHDAEDVLQQVAVETARSFDRYDSNRPFLPWVLTIARRAVLRYFEQQQKRPVIYTDSTLELLAEYHAQPTTDSDEQAALRECVSQLPEKSRRLLGLRYDDSLSSTEIAAASGLTPESVRVVLSRIRKQLMGCVRSKLAPE